MFKLFCWHNWMSAHTGHLDYYDKDYRTYHECTKCGKRTAPMAVPGHSYTTKGKYNVT